MKDSTVKRALTYLILAGALLVTGLFMGRASANVAVPCEEGMQCMFLPLVQKRDPFIPEAPNLVVTEIEANERYRLDWSDGAEDEVLFWELQTASNDSFTTRELIQFFDTSYEFDFSGGVRYYRVRGVGEGGFGEWSNVVSVNASSFFADKAVVDRSVDECATLSWNFSGIKAFRVRLGKGYDLQAANGVDSANVCPSVETTYVAQVTNLDDTVDTYEVTIGVTGSGCNLDPVINKFTSSNFNPAPNELFTVSWSVECANAVFYKVGDLAERPVTGNEENTESTPVDRSYRLKVQARNGTVVIAEGIATINIDVK